MIQYMLDTNICIYLINQQPEHVIERFKRCRVGEAVISAVTWGELSCGRGTHNTPAQLDALLAVLLVVPFDTVAATRFGELSHQFPNRKNSFDRMIAAHALSLGATLVTHNTADFALYGLPVENWVAPQGDTFGGASNDAPSEFL